MTELAEHQRIARGLRPPVALLSRDHRLGSAQPRSGKAADELKTRVPRARAPLTAQCSTGPWRSLSTSIPGLQAAAALLRPRPPPPSPFTVHPGESALAASRTVPRVIPGVRTITVNPPRPRKRPIPPAGCGRATSTRSNRKPIAPARPSASIAPVKTTASGYLSHADRCG